MERGKDSNALGGCSSELLSVGASPGGLYEKLLINKKQSGKSGAAPPIVRMPRSSILDRVQSFLPELAQANENLSKEMESSPAGTFDIENIEEEEKIIEMNVAVVELSDTDSSDAEGDSSSDDSSDSELCQQVTEENIRLSKTTKKGKIEVLEQ